MTTEEWKAFVLTGTRTGKLATVRADGRAHVVPIWFLLDDDGAVVFTTGARSAKGQAMRRDLRVSLLVDDEQPPYAFVLVRGTAELSTDTDQVLAWATRIGARYMGEDRAEEFGRRNAAVDELLVRIVPEQVIAETDIAGY
jgi:PPOX class probable F420-dependent enzyme